MCFHWKSISIMACPAVVIFLPWCGPHVAEWRQHVLGGRVLLLYCSKNKIKWLKGQRGTTEAQQRQTTYCSHTSWSTWPFEGTITNKKRYLKWLLTIRPPAVWSPPPFHSPFKWRQTQPFISLCSGVNEAKHNIIWEQSLFWAQSPYHSPSPEENDCRGCCFTYYTSPVASFMWLLYMLKP